MFDKTSTHTATGGGGAGSPLSLRGNKYLFVNSEIGALAASMDVCSGSQW